MLVTKSLKRPKIKHLKALKPKLLQQSSQISLRITFLWLWSVADFKQQQQFKKRKKKAGIHNNLQHPFQIQMVRQQTIKKIALADWLHRYRRNYCWAQIGEGFPQVQDFLASWRWYIPHFKSQFYYMFKTK